MKKTIRNESVLDFPKEGLCPEVWKKVIDKTGKHETWILADDAKAIIENIQNQLQKMLGLHDYNMYIIGSITSNQYSEDSDIDLHLVMPMFHFSEQISDTEKTRILRKAFEKVSGPKSIGNHPIEVYYQPNHNQDLMSVGCYSLYDDTWEVGPEIVPTNFNPYQEYYDEDMRYVNNLIGQVRSLILEAYELALVFSKVGEDSSNPGKLIDKLQKAAQLFTEIRESRSALSEPKSREEALEKRSDRRWKIADSAFKLLDKFGYLAILREYTKCIEEELSPSDASEKVIAAVRDNLGPKNKKLHEEDSEIQRDIKLWIDDVREAPEGYVWIKSTNDFMRFIDQNGISKIQIIDIDHDAGDYQKDGGDYIRCLDYLEFLGASNIKIRLHSQNPVGVQNMRRIIKKNNWEEVQESVDESQEVNEGLKSLAMLFILGCAASFPGILHGKTLSYAANLGKQSPKFQERQKYFTDALKFVNPQEKLNQYTFAQNANILACTYYGEGRGEIKLDAFDPIVDTTLNRAQQDVKKVALVCIARAEGKKAYQYSFWNKNQTALDSIKLGRVVVPYEIKTNVLEKAAWDTCVKRAIDVLTGAYTSQDKTINSYYVTNMEDPPSWANQMVGAYQKGNHTFGYVKTNDPKYVDMTTLKPIVRAKKTYKIKSGDTLSKIAATYKTTVKELSKKNNITNPNKIRIGQEIMI